MLINGKWVNWSNQNLDISVSEANAMQKKADEFCYYEASLLKSSCNYMGDEVELIFEEGKSGEGHMRCFFSGCVKVEFNFWPSHPKSVPYHNVKNCWLQGFLISQISVTPKEQNPVTNTYYQCKLDIFPLDVVIWCKEIDFSKVSKLPD